MELNEAREQIDRIDAEMEALFVRRMALVGEIAAYKRANGLPVEDKAREAELLASRGRQIEDAALRALYLRFLRQTIDLSKRRQQELISGQEDDV